MIFSLVQIVVAIVVVCMCVKGGLDYCGHTPDDAACLTDRQGSKPKIRD